MLKDKLQDKVLTDEQTELVVGGAFTPFTLSEISFGQEDYKEKKSSRVFPSDFWHGISGN